MTNEINQILKIKENSIISLDYYSHKQLKDIGFEHEIYDDYLTKNDKEEINRTTLQITANWYKNKIAEEHLKLNGINLGWLLEQEFYIYLLTVLTNFVSLLRIKEKKSPKIVIVSSNLFEMAREVFQNCEIRLLEEIKINQVFAFDVFEVKYNLGTIPLVIKMPRKYFFAIRYYYEKLFLPFYNKIFSKISGNKSSVILVDFDVTQYEEFLRSLSQKNKNIFLLNRRRVSIWNFRSFSIIKKMGCIPVAYEHFLNKDDKNEITALIAEMRKKLDHLLTHDTLFSNMFSFNNLSFWNYLNKYFKDYCLPRFEEAIYEMIGSKKLLSHINPSLILNFYDVTLQEKVLINQAREQKIPSILIQHGTPYLSLPSFSMYNPIVGTLPLYNDKKIAVWGNLMKEYAIKNGIKEENIIVSGSIRHDSYFQMKKNQNNNEVRIIIAIGNLSNLNVDAQTIKTYDKFEESLRIICTLVKKIKDHKSIAKLHPGNMHHNTVVVEPIIKKTNPEIQIVVSTYLPELIKSADAVITIGLTTFLFDSNIFGKPTLTLVADDQDFLSLHSSGYTELFTPSEVARFEKFLIDVLNDPKIRDKYIQKETEYVNSYFANQGHASEYLAKKIAEY